MTTITDQIGRELAGRYRLEAGLGSGASAVVYLATDLRLGRQVAVKLLHAGLRGDLAFLRRFEVEAQSVASLHHPNLLQVFDWGEEPEPFIVLELCAGGSLRDLLDGGTRLSVSQAAAVTAAAARGLAYAHRRGLIHRDVKPANVLFDEDGGVRVADFGLARALAEAAWTEPAGSVLGTARYASPEQAEGRPLDQRSDVYSLALVCFEAVTGKVPFSRETTVATLMARVGALLPTAPELGPLSPILAQAAISEPLARLDADELAANLELLLRNLPAPEPLPLAPRTIAGPPPAVPAGAPRRHGAATGAPAPTWAAAAPTAAATVGAETTPARGGEVGRPAPRPVRPGRWRRRLTGVAAVVVLAAAGGVAVELLVLHRSVPRLGGVAVGAARAEVAHDGLRLVVAGERYSISVPTGAVLAMTPAPGTRVARGSAVRVVVSRGRPPEALPKVAGSAAAAAVAAVRRAHLVPSVQAVYDPTVPAGTVVSTSPAAGPLRYGSTVEVRVSKGPAPVTVPAIGGGSSWSSADSALQAVRLVPVETYTYSDTVPAGDVLGVTPAPGTTGVAVGTHVTVEVSRGPRLVAVPPVAGDSIATAIGALRAAGFVVTEQIGPPFATKATTTLPAPGAEERPGASVTLYVA